MNGSADGIDVLVGQRIRQQRTLRGISQDKLGQLIGVSFQQVQKYESGANRISASRLFTVSRALEAPIEFFFSETGETRADGEDETEAERINGAPADVLSRRETLKLVRFYYDLPERLRPHVVELLRAISIEDA